MNTAEPRVLAVRALTHIHREQGYSNIVLDQLLRDAALSPPDTALVTRLIYGVVERRLTLDYLIGACSSVPIRKMHPLVADCLRIGVYQLLYMDRIPAAAAVNETVRAAKLLGQGHASGFVNGVLRGVQRRHAALLDELPAGDAGDAIRYSCPEPLIALWRKAYGAELTRGLLDALNQPPPAYVRVNTCQTTDEDMLAALQEQGIEATPVAGLPHCLQIHTPALLKTLAKSAKNWYYFQDSASQWCCMALDAQPGERVADVCAAPGGKSFTTAQWMQNRGEVTACDVYPAKCDTMAARAEQLGLSVVRTVCRDATAPVPSEWAGAFDRVLCDAPCSGFGVIRRKPEIRYKSFETVAALPEQQLCMLERAAELVRAGGVLQYSTCTLHPAENSEVAQRFLAAHPEFSPRALPLSALPNPLGEPAWYRTLLPPVHNTDGFFLAGFTRA